MKRISDARYANLIKHEALEKRWNAIQPTKTETKLGATTPNNSLGCDPAFQQELDRVKAELEVDDFLALASEEMEIRELLDRADRRGEVYGVGYDEGFWAGRELQNKYEIARQEAISLKYDALKR